MKRKVILLGTKPGSSAAYLYLRQRGWEVTQVVSPNSDKSHVSNWMPGPDLAQLASHFGTPVVDSQEKLQDSNVDLVISYMHRQRVSARTRSMGKYALNFHAGLLPHFAGWRFYSSAILEESSEYGVTCHLMEEEFDEGPIIQVRRFPIQPELETALTLERQSQKEMILLFRDVINRYEELGALSSREQVKEESGYMTRNEFDELKVIPSSADAKTADRIARAFYYPPYTLAHVIGPNGNILEVLPESIKHQLAKNHHSEDFKVLLEALALEYPLAD